MPLLSSKSTDMHKVKLYTHQFLDLQRGQQDTLADHAIKVLFESGQAKYFSKVNELLISNDYSIPDSLPRELKDFLETSRVLPEWSDDKLIKKGQAFFRQHASSLTLMLGLMSLPYDYAAANGAQVLVRSQRLTQDVGKRLVETGKYVFDVGSPDGFAPKGNAIASAQKVRLIHAAIRYHISKSADWDPSWGKPINQEDMAGTNLSMSLIPIRGMRKLGISVSTEEALAYIHLWNVASSMMGVVHELLPDTAKESFLLDKMIRERQFKRSEAGVALTAALLDYVSQNAGNQLAWFAPKYMRFLLGDTVANMLDIPEGNVAAEQLLNPLVSWNQLIGLIQPKSDSFYQAKDMYRANSKKVSPGKKVSLKVPDGLKG
jgi:hypothetical protein